MPIGRENIYFALFNQIQTLAVTMNPNPDPLARTYLPKQANPPFAFADRRYNAPGQLPSPAMYPALMMYERGELYERELMWGPAVINPVVHVCIQSIDGEDPNAVPAIIMNQLCEALEDCIETGAGSIPPGMLRGRNTLFGLVQVARVTGREVKYYATQEARYSESTFEVEIILADY